jgi:T5SS/PEP-CTERM-associated repeat protein
MSRSHFSSPAMALRTVRSILRNVDCPVFRASENGTVPFAALLALAMSLFPLGPPTAARAAITPNGDVSPDPTTTPWDSSTYGYVGNTASGTLTVDGGSDLLASYGYIGHGNTATGVVNISGSRSTWSNRSHLYVGDCGSGTLSITGGGSVSSTFGRIGSATGSTGLATVSGLGSTWSNGLYFYVGDFGSGTLAITAGGTVRSMWSYIGSGSTGSAGLALVSGTGSIWASSDELCVGNSGNGTLSITDGGTASSGSSYIGSGMGSTGLATVSGIGSTWANSADLYVGNSGNGTLSIGNGGFVSVAGTTFVAYAGTNTGSIDFGSSVGTLSTGGLVARGADLKGTGVINTRGLISDMNLAFNSIGILSTTFGGAGTMTVDMSAASGNGVLGIGYMDTATLTIVGGARVYSTNGYLGYGTGSTGVATVSGSTWTNSADLYVGRYGNGTLSIGAGGFVSVGSTTYIAHSGTNTGVIDFGTGGGTLSTRSLSAPLTKLKGIGTVVVREFVGDLNLTFNSIAAASGTFDTAGTLIVDMSAASGNGNLGVGYANTATLTITGGARVYSANGDLGYGTGSTGFGTVSGSTWTNSGSLFVGRYGNGMLSITDGGAVSVAGTTYVAYAGTNTGTIDFGSGGGTLSAAGLCARGADLKGTGTINTRGLVSDLTLAFNSVGSLSTTFGTAGTMTVDMRATGGNGDLGVGYASTATLTITGGAKAYSANGYLGYGTGSTGVATVSGSASKWSNSALYVGNSGSGTLSISARGIVADTTGYVGYGSASTGVAIVSGPNSGWTNSGALYVGNSGGGTLSISARGTVSNTTGYIGFGTNSIGMVMVSGSGTRWTNSSGLCIGNYGSGTLSITSGGSVSSTSGDIGPSTNSTGVVMVSGSGTRWTNSSGLYVGHNGSGTLSIGSGGTVTASNIDLGNHSRLMMDIGYGSLLTVGSSTGTSYDGGTTSLSAGVGAATGAYTPITVVFDGCHGSARYLAIGGTWNATSHVFTVSTGAMTASGSSVTIDRAAIQRILVVDSHTGWELGASVLGTTTSSTASTMSMIASVLTGGTIDALKTTSGESVLSAWTISTTGYTVSDATPMYLSMRVGTGQSLDDLALWHYDGTNWTEFHAVDLAYDGTYACFTVTGLSGYAVTLVPEPGTLGLLSAAIVGLAVCRRRRNGDKVCL